MNSRHRAREVALQILYRYDVAAQDKGTQPPSEAPVLALELGQHFDHFQVPEPMREFAAELVAGTLREIPLLDGLIEKHASNWKVSRMSLVDRSLLRMAAFELRHFADTSTSVVIDEAIELAKQFGTEDTPAFINGVLDALKTSVRPN